MYFHCCRCYSFRTIRLCLYILFSKTIKIKSLTVYYLKDKMSRNRRKAERFSPRSFSSYPACKHRCTAEQAAKQRGARPQHNQTSDLNWSVCLQYGQQDGQHVGQFTCQTARGDFTDARGAEVHSHDTCTGNSSAGCGAAALISSSTHDRFIFIDNVIMIMIIDNVII